jgi:hypothetical protein
MSGKRLARRKRTIIRRLCGHVSTGPSGVRDQSRERMSVPISPPPTNTDA